MPIKRIGQYCSRCGTRPAWQNDLCVPCAGLLRAFGKHVPDARPEPPLTEAHLLDYRSYEFSQELSRWRAGGMA